jgi:hypothetical protein
LEGRSFSGAAAQGRQEQATAKAKAIISRCGFAIAPAFGRVEIASQWFYDAGLKPRSTQKQRQRQQQRQNAGVSPLRRQKCAAPGRDDGSSWGAGENRQPQQQIPAG